MTIGCQLGILASSSIQESNNIDVYDASDDFSFSMNGTNTDNVTFWRKTGETVNSDSTFQCANNMAIIRDTTSLYKSIYRNNTTGVFGIINSATPGSAKLSGGSVCFVITVGQNFRYILINGSQASVGSNLIHFRSVSGTPIAQSINLNATESQITNDTETTLGSTSRYVFTIVTGVNAGEPFRCYQNNVLLPASTLLPGNAPQTNLAANFEYNTGSKICLFGDEANLWQCNDTVKLHELRFFKNQFLDINDVSNLYDELKIKWNTV